MIIMLSGKRQSGKTTLARMLEKEYGYHVVGLADPLYDIYNMVANSLPSNPWLTAALAALSGTYTYPQLGPYHGELPEAQRRVLIQLGAYIREHFGTNTLCWETQRRISKLPLNAKYRGMSGKDIAVHNVVIHNFRFPDEAKFFASDNQHVTTVRLERVGYERPDDGVSTDASETALDNYAFDLRFEVPDGDMEAMRRVAKTLAGLPHRGQARF